MWREATGELGSASKHHVRQNHRADLVASGERFDRIFYAQPCGTTAVQRTIVNSLHASEFYVHTAGPPAWPSHSCSAVRYSGRDRTDMPYSHVRSQHTQFDCLLLNS